MAAQQIPGRGVLRLALALAMALTITSCGVFGDDSSSSTSVPNGVRLVDLEPGMCYQRPLNTDVRVVERIGCRKRHDAEAYAVFAIDGGPDAPYPGGAAVQSLAQQGCQDRFADYVGQAYEDSQYYFSAIAPTRSSWDDRRDRRVLCSILPAGGGRLEGSVKAPTAD